MVLRGRRRRRVRGGMVVVVPHQSGRGRGNVAVAVLEKIY